MAGKPSRKGVTMEVNRPKENNSIYTPCAEPSYFGFGYSFGPIVTVRKENGLKPNQFAALKGNKRHWGRK